MDETLQERLPYAGRAVGVLSAIALHGYGVEIDSETQIRWASAMRAMRVSDSAVDDFNNPDRVKNLAGFISSFRESYPALAPESLGATRFGNLICTAGSIIEYGELLRSARTPEEYIPLRIAEAEVTADVVLDLATDKVTQQPKYSTHFAPTVYALTKAAGFMDTATDAVRDYQDGTLAFRPSAAFRLDLFQRGLDELAPLKPLLRRPAILGALGDMSLKSLKSARLKRK